jgi:outer membrane protein
MLAASLVVAPVAGAQTRVAVVNIGKLVTDSPQAAAARQKMDQEFAARRKKLEGSEQKLAADLEKAKKDQAVMSAEARKTLEQDLQNKQKEFLKEKNQYNADVARRQEQELIALQKIIQETVNQVAKEAKYDLVMSDGIVYAADTINITDKVLAAMRAKAGKP